MVPRTPLATGCLAALALLFSLESHAQVVTTGDSDNVRVVVGRTERTARWSPAGVSGTNANLRRVGTTLRGTSDVLDVSLDWATGRIEGDIGQQRVSLFVGGTERGVDLEGQVGDSPVNLLINAGRIAGALGPCNFTLLAAGRAYTGYRHCEIGAVPVRMTLQLPRSLSAEAPAHVSALVLSLLMPLTHAPSSQPLVSAQSLAPAAPYGGSGAASSPSPFKAKFGFEVQDAAQGSGAQVVGLLPGTVGARAGLDEGMRILRVGKEDVRGAEDLRRSLSRARRGTSVVLEVRRPGADATTLFRSVTVP